MLASRNNTKLDPLEFFFSSFPNLYLDPSDLSLQLPPPSPPPSPTDLFSLLFPAFPPSPTKKRTKKNLCKNKNNKQTIALVGAAVTGVLAHRRREEAELLNAKLRAIAGELRDRAADSAEPGACQADEDGESMRAYRMGLEQVLDC